MLCEYACPQNVQQLVTKCNVKSMELIDPYMIKSYAYHNSVLPELAVNEDCILWNNVVITVFVMCNDSREFTSNPLQA